MFPTLVRIPNAWSALSGGAVTAEIVFGVAAALAWAWAAKKKIDAWWVGLASTAAFVVAGHLLVSKIQAGESIPIHTFGVMVVLGFLVGAWYMKSQGSKLGIDDRRVFDFAMYILLAGIVGARLFYVFLNYSQYVENKMAVFALWEGGLVWYGGMFTAIPVGFYLVYKYKMPAAQLADITSAGTLLGLGIGRWGCFCVGDDYGSPTDVPWSVTFDDPEALVAPKLKGVPLHPTQLYMSVNALWVFAFVEWIRRRARYAGTAFGAMLIAYAVTRGAFIEPLRGDFVERNPAYGRHLAVELRLSTDEGGEAVSLTRGTPVADPRTGEGGQLLSDVEIPAGGGRAEVHILSNDPLVADKQWNPVDGFPAGVSVDVLGRESYASHLPSPPSYVSTSQWVSIAIILAGLLTLWIARRLERPGFAKSVAALEAEAAASG